MSKGKYRDGRANNRTPQEHQFKKGEPSRRKGRKFPKRPPSAEEQFRKVAFEKITVMNGDTELKLTRIGACLLVLQKLAISGNTGAARLFDQFREAFGVSSEIEWSMVILADEREWDI